MCHGCRRSGLTTQLRRTATALVTLSLILLSSRLASAEVISGRATLSGAYGALIAFYQDDDAPTLEPDFGHGVFLRGGGERCGRICIGASVLGSIAVDPSGEGWLGVGPHLAIDRALETMGPLTGRFGLAYHYLRAYDRTYDTDGSFERSEEAEGAHGFGLWMELSVQLLRRPVSPTIGLLGGYVAALTSDPPAHRFTVQAVLGFAFGNRVVFGQVDEADEDGSDDDAEDDGELDDVEERRLRDAEDVLRRF